MAANKQVGFDIVAHDKTKAALEAAAGGLNKLKVHAQNMSTGMGIASGVAGAAVLAFAKSAVNKYEQVGRETIKLSRLTGGTAEEMSRLRVQAQLSGVPFDTLTKSVGMLSRSLSAKGGARLDEWGISARTASGEARPFQDLLGDMAEKFESMPNGIDKNKAAMDLFGRSGTDMIPILNKGRDGLAEMAAKADELGLTLNGEALGAMKEHIAKQREMALAVDGMKVAVGEALMPVIEKGTELVGGLAGGFSKLPDPVKDLAVYGAAAAGGVALASSAVRFMGNQLSTVVDGVRALRDGAVKAVDALKGLGASGAGGLAAGAVGLALIEVAASAERAAIKAEDLLRVVDRIADSKTIAALAGLNAELDHQPVGFWGRVEANIPAIGGLVSDVRGAQAAVSEMNKMIEQNPEKAEKFIDAMIRSGKSVGPFAESLVDLKAKAHDAATTTDEERAATEAADKATRFATDGLKAYSDQLKANSDPLFAMIDSNQKLADAQGKVFAAQVDVNTALREHGARSPEYAAATRSLADANDTVVRSAFDWDAAQAVLAQKLRDNPKMIGEVRAELARLVDSHQITAEQAQITAFKIGLVGANARAASGSYDLIFNARTNGFTGVNGVIGQIQAAMRSGTGVPLPGRAVGGPVSAGTAYLVGERGPEMFVSSSSGSIVPNGQLSSGGITVNVTAGVGDPQSIGAQVVEVLRQYERSNGAGWRAA